MDHGQWGGDGRRLGALDFGSDTSAYYRDRIFQPWFDYWLREQGKLSLAEASTFETGTNEWQEYDSWPPKQGVEMRKLYFDEGRRLSFGMPRESGYDEYVSDPANPVPYRPRPIPPPFPGQEWKTWLMQDQRFVDHRPDVLSWETLPLPEDFRVAGNIVTDLYVSTSGTDLDWVVKLIDVYPDDDADDPESKTHMGAFELFIADEILRVRFRNGFEKAHPGPSDKTVHYSIAAA